MPFLDLHENSPDGATAGAAFCLVGTPTPGAA